MASVQTGCAQGIAPSPHRRSTATSVAPGCAPRSLDDNLGEHRNEDPFEVTAEEAAGRSYIVRNVCCGSASRANPVTPKLQPRDQGPLGLSAPQPSLPTRRRHSSIRSKPWPILSGAHWQ